MVPNAISGLNMATCTMKDVYDKFSLETTTRDFVGHSMALYQSDDYISESGKAAETINRIRLYVNSMARYGKSPYIYPLYGLGELPQGFARLSAIHGGTYMLNANVDEVLYENGKVSGIKATMKERGEPGEGFSFTTKTKKIIADPSYFPQKTKVVGHLLKAICILNHPIDKTDDSDSLQLIIPQSQVGRKHGMFPLYPLSSKSFDLANLCIFVPLKTSISPWFHPPTTSVPRVIILPLSLLSLKARQTTIWSSSQALTA